MDMAWAHTRCWLERRIDAALLEQSRASSAVAWVGGHACTTSMLLSTVLTQFQCLQLGR